METLIIIVCFIVLVAFIVGVVNANTESDENIQTFDFNKSSGSSYSSNYSYSSSGSSDTNTKSESSNYDDELRGDFTPVALPAITKEQREMLRKTVKNFSPVYEYCPGAVLSPVGMTYRSKAAKEVYATLKVGDRIILKPEEDNDYDETAVRVYAKRCHIGYINSKYSSQVYLHCVLDKIYDCYVIEPSEPNRLSGLKFVLFINQS